MSSLDDMYLMLRHAYEEFPDPDMTDRMSLCS